MMSSPFSDATFQDFVAVMLLHAQICHDGFGGDIVEQALRAYESADKVIEGRNKWTTAHQGDSSHKVWGGVINPLKR
jgi:hypothetical protein